MNKPFVTLVINYNGKKFLDGCLSSLLAISGEINDVVLVDNNSQDGSREFVSKNFPQVRVINTGSNLGFSGAYNHAHQVLKKGSNYRYYFILNNDTVVADKGIFARAKLLFESLPRVGIINPTILNSDGTIQSQGGRYIFLTGTTIGSNSGKEFIPENKVVSSHWSSGCALFIPEKLFEEIGGFDDYFMYQEDVGLSWKVLNRGYQVITDCKSAITHFAGGTSKLSTFEHYFAERNRIILYYQNLSPFSLIFTLPILLFGRILLLPMQKNLKIAWAKCKGDAAGLLLMMNFPRRNNSLVNDWRVVKYYFSQPVSKLV